MYMLNDIKKMTFLLVLSLLSGCGAAIRHLDSSWVDDRTVYDKSQPLPSLEIPPTLSESQSISQVQSQSVTPPNKELMEKEQNPQVRTSKLKSP